MIQISERDYKRLLAARSALADALAALINAPENKLHPVPDPDGVSPHAKDIGDTAALFIAITQRNVQAMIEEVDKCQPGDDARHVLVAALQTDLKFVADVLSATSQSLTDVWTDLTSARSKLHSNPVDR